MYFVLPNLSMGSDRRGFDTLSVSFKCADSKPAFVDAAAQSGFDFTSKFFAAWDMAEACPAMTGGKLFLDPLFMHLSLLGGPRTRRWHLKAAFIVCFAVGAFRSNVLKYVVPQSISIDNASPEPGRPLYLPQISVMPGKEPIPLLDSQAIRLGGQGVLRKSSLQFETLPVRLIANGSLASRCNHRYAFAGLRAPSSTTQVESHAENSTH